MSPVRRNILYAVSFETLGRLVASVGRLVMSEASAGTSFALSVIAASIALGWSYLHDTVFEAWEARQGNLDYTFVRELRELRRPKNCAKE